MSRLGLVCQALKSLALESSFLGDVATNRLSLIVSQTTGVTRVLGVKGAPEFVGSSDGRPFSCVSTPRQQEQKEQKHGAAIIPPTAIHPWTPTRLLEKRKTLPKRMGHMLMVLEKEKEEEARAARAYPDFKAGDMIELKLSIPQNKGRETVFKGICISRRNRGWRTSFTLRNVIGNSGGIERSFPLYSPHIQGVRLLEGRKRKKYRRSKLYYLRNLQPKEYRIT